MYSGKYQIFIVIEERRDKISRLREFSDFSLIPVLIFWYLNHLIK